MPTAYESLKICMTRPKVQSCSMAAQETGLERQGFALTNPSLISSYRESRVISLDDREGSVSIGMRLINVQTLLL